MRSEITGRESRTWLVLGASGTIGLAILRSEIDAGNRVIAASRSSEWIGSLPAKHRDHIEWVHFDSEDESSLFDFEQRVNGVIVASGISVPIPLHLYGSEVNKIFSVNFFAPLRVISMLVRKRLIERGGRIVFLSSIASKIGVPGMGPYAASKGAIDSIIRNLASELARFEITVNAVNPGLVISPLLTESNRLRGKGFEADYPLGFIEPEEVASCVAFLLAPLSKRITGQTLIVDSGLTLQ